jgi:hypothetical protein
MRSDYGSRLSPAVVSERLEILIAREESKAPVDAGLSN